MTETKSSTRDELAPFLDTRVTCEGYFDRSTVVIKRGDREVKTTLFQDLVVTTDTKEVIDIGHIWVQYTVNFQAHDLHFGDKVRFRARVGRYYKRLELVPANSSSIKVWCHNLTYPDQIEVLERNPSMTPKPLPDPEPADIAEESVELSKGDLIRQTVQKLSSGGADPSCMEIIRYIKATHGVDVSLPYVSNTLKVLREAVGVAVAVPVGAEDKKAGMTALDFIKIAAQLRALSDKVGGTSALKQIIDALL
ncbi:hypothetical protein AYO40_03430 [Planctomycetaceae bacterium SCGC AG-212-D15]|nr:hypothetical protein AYO40_03430 [Planctomycetaceae bacterium SCGC AG-212-D15]